MAGGNVHEQRQYCVDTASLRGAYRAKSEVLAEPKFARIAKVSRSKYHLGEWLGPGGGIACRVWNYLCVVGKMVGGLGVHVAIASHRRA